MEKIICSLEEWDSILNYYRPNGSSKTWYLKELKQLHLPNMKVQIQLRQHYSFIEIESLNNIKYINE